MTAYVADMVVLLLYYVINDCSICILQKKKQTEKQKQTKTGQSIKRLICMRSCQQCKQVDVRMVYAFDTDTFENRKKNFPLNINA